MTRARLPDRRPSRTVETEWQGHAITLTLGFDPASGALREVFANPARGAMHATIADACVAFSVALQHGVPLEALGRSTLRAPDAFGQDQPASPLGAILDALQAEPPAVPVAVFLARLRGDDALAAIEEGRV